MGSKKTTANVCSTVLEHSYAFVIIRSFDWPKKNSTPLLLRSTKYFSGRQLDFSLFSARVDFCEWNRPFFQKVFVEFDLTFRFVVE